MAEMTIRLSCDPLTGKKQIVVSLTSDADALPHEHEQQHRALVDRLLEGGLIQAGEEESVIIEREQAQPAAPPQVAEPAQPHRGSLDQGQ